jgi:hypothetical protein
MSNALTSDDYRLGPLTCSRGHGCCKRASALQQRVLGSGKGKAGSYPGVLMVHPPAARLQPRQQAAAATCTV